MAKRGRISGDEIALKNAIKEKAQNMSAYLNRLEEIFSTYSSKEQNEDKVGEISMLTGKIIISFSDFCSMVGVYDDES